MVKSQIPETPPCTPCSTRCIINSVGHVIGGGFLSYLFIPKAELWVLLLFTSGFGAVREHIQELRGHYNGGKYVKYTDALEWAVGAIIYNYLHKKCNLDADKGYRSEDYNDEGLNSSSKKLK